LEEALMIHLQSSSRVFPVSLKSIALCLPLLLSGALFAQLLSPIILAHQQTNTPSSTTQIPPIQGLEVNRPIEREMRGGELHTYQITLAAKQYIRIIVEQKGVDVIVKMLAPDEKVFIESNRDKTTQSGEMILLITETVGDYKVEVRASNQTAALGQYKISVAELRAATDQDRSAVNADLAFLQGLQLNNKGTKEARQQAIVTFQEAARLAQTINDKKLEGKSLLSAGIGYYELGEKTQALELLTKALALVQSGESRETEADALDAIGNVYQSNGDRENALHYLSQSLAIRRELKGVLGLAQSLTNVGQLYLSLGQGPKALELFNEALPLVQQIDERNGEAVLLNSIGIIYDRMGDTGKALDYYNRSLPIRRAIGDKKGEAVSLSNMGIAYGNLAEKQKELEAYLQALPLRRETGDKQGESSTLNNLGEYYREVGEKDKALEYQTQALQLRRALGDKQGQVVSLNNLGRLFEDFGESARGLDYYTQALAINREIGNQQRNALLLNNIGRVHFNLGDYQQALEYFNQALPLRLATKDKRGEATTLSNIGNTYNKTGDKAKALELLNQALAIFQSVGDRRTEGNAFYSIGVVYSEMQDQQKALTYFNKSLLLKRASLDRSGEAATLFAMAKSERHLGNLAQATTTMNEAMQIIESLRSRTNLPQLQASYFATVQDYYAFNVDLLMQRQKIEATQNHIATAFETSERARARSLLDALKEANANIREGLASELLQQERELQTRFNAKADRLSILLNGKPTPEQEAKAKRELDEMQIELQQVEAKIRQASPRYAALTQPQPLKLAEIQRQVVDDESLLLEYSLGKERSYLFVVAKQSIKTYELPKRAEIEAAAQRVYELLTARNQFIAYETIGEKRARVEKADADFNQAAAALSQMILAPVAPQLTNQRLLVVTDGTLQYVPFAMLPLPQTQRAESTKPESQPSANAPSTRRLAYTPLISGHEVVSLPSASTLAVLRSELKGRKVAPKMVAVLADPVFDTNDERFKLAQAHKNIANKKTAPSMVAQARRNPNTRGQSSPATVPVTGQTKDHSSAAKAQAKVASTPVQGASHTSTVRSKEQAPVIESDLTRAARDVGFDTDASSLPRIPFTRREAEAITARVAPSLRKEAVDFEASRATALSPELSQYRYVHFATHGFLNTTHPELSGIALSMIDEDGNAQDGFLRAHEVFNLKLPAELVVLSGCRTGLGKEIRGEGLIGLTRGFMYAGAARVLVSLWDVNDEATAELMSRFYKAMLGKEQMTPAAALRAAQASMAKESRWRAPYYWAAFVLQGEPR
jgi:tetratricopeptide (TPR) repeat protein